jgi:hypothetical protein
MFRCAPWILALGFVAGCTHVQPSDIAISERAACEVEASREMPASRAAATSFCVHTVTAMTPSAPGNNCNPADVGFAVGDSLCMNCKSGACPATTTFVTDDGVWLRACTISTTRTNNACQNNWPRGTCKHYITL